MPLEGGSETLTTPLGPLVLQVADLTMGDLLVHAPVTWINPPSALVKSKKDPELAAFGTVSRAAPEERRRALSSSASAVITTASFTS